MYKQQFSKESELSNGKIGTTCSLEALYAANTHTDMSGLDHADVVGTVTDSKCQ